jgi:hypothetical protein
MCRAGVDQGTDSGPGYVDRQLQSLWLADPSNGVQRDQGIGLCFLRAEAILFQLQLENAFDRTNLQVFP